MARRSFVGLPLDGEIADRNAACRAGTVTGARTTVAAGVAPGLASAAGRATLIALAAQPAKVIEAGAKTGVVGGVHGALIADGAGTTGNGADEFSAAPRPKGLPVNDTPFGGNPPTSGGF